MLRLRSIAVAIALAFVATIGCDDPVLKQREQSLGADPGKYPEGPLHRAGQPCTWCHNDDGSADPLDLAGTVYARRSSSEPLEGVTVRVFDAQGRTATRQTNAAGNFYFDQGELSLDFPLFVEVEYQGEVTAMQTPIRRQRSCAACHRDPTSPDRVGHIYLWETE